MVVESGGPSSVSALRARTVRESAWLLERVFDVFPLLAEVRRSKGSWLSGGEQQALAIARALVANPRLLLLDEPSEGLAPRLVEMLIEQLRVVQSTGMAILLAEQHAGLVKELARRVYALERGAIRALGGSPPPPTGGDAFVLRVPAPAFPGEKHCHDVLWAKYGRFFRTRCG